MSDEAEEVVTGLSIDDATPDSSVGGGELIPVSDAGSPKSVTVGQIKDFVLAKIAELTDAGAFSVNDDSVFILRGGVLKPVDADVLAAALFNEAFGRAGVAAPNGNEVIAVKDSTARKTLTLAQIKTWLQANMTVTPDLTLSTAGAAGTLGDSDLALVVQAASGKKVTLATLKDYVLGKLSAYITAATAAQTVTSSDVIFISQGGNMRKATVAQLLSALAGGDVSAPATHVPGNIPAWDNAQKKLTSGYGVANSINSESPSADKIPTEAAVRTAIADAAGVAPPSSHTAGNVPTWEAGNKLTNGYSVTTTVRDNANAADTAIPTEKAVRTAVDAKIAAPESHTENCIPTWGAANELKPGKSVVEVLASNGSNDNIPTEKAVRDALPVPATNSSAGLLTAADKAKLDNLVDQTAVPEVGDDSPLDDTDALTVLKGGTTWKKSLLYRLWTYIMGKLPSFRLDALGAPEDNSNLNADTTRHGLCPKFPGGTSRFLRGDGTFAEPAGTTDFTGDSGSGGAHGLVPAPESGDASANKFLNANGSWAVPPSAAGVDIPGATEIDAADGADVLYCYDTSANAYRKVTLAEVAALVMGTERYDNIFVPAAAMVPSAENGATAGSLTFTNVKRDTMAFSHTVGQGAEFSVVMPEDWNKGTVRAKLLWTAYDSTRAEQGEMVAWKVGAVSTPDEGAITVAPENYVTVTDNLSQVNELHRTGATGRITAEGTRGDGNLVHFVVKRNVSAETTNPMDTDALLLGVWIQYGRTADVTTEWS